MQNLVFEWVDFHNFPNLSQNCLIKSGWLVYEWVTFFLKIDNVYGSIFKFPAARPYQDQTWVPHWVLGVGMGLELLYLEA